VNFLRSRQTRHSQLAILLKKSSRHNWKIPHTVPLVTMNRNCIHCTVSLVIIGKQSFLNHGLLQKILPHLFIAHPVFTSLDSQQYFFYRISSSALRPTPNLEEQVSVFMSPSDKMVWLYPQAPGSLFVALYDPQGCGGGFLNRLHTVTNNIAERWHKCHKVSGFHVDAFPFLTTASCSL
jgi:hypothetical protein